MALVKVMMGSGLGSERAARAQRREWNVAQSEERETIGNCEDLAPHARDRGPVHG